MKSKFWIWFIPLLLISCFGIYLFLEKNKVDIPEQKKDSIQIQEEYEELNNNTNYTQVSLGEENAFVYASLSNIEDLFNGKDGIIYIGTTASQAARKTISLLNEAVNTTSIEKIYYIDSKKMESELNILLLKKLNIIKINPATIITVQGGNILKNYSLYHKYENDNLLSEEEKESILGEYKNIISSFIDACDENC